MLFGQRTPSAVGAPKTSPEPVQKDPSHESSFGTTCNRKPEATSFGDGEGAAVSKGRGMYHVPTDGLATAKAQPS